MAERVRFVVPDTDPVVVAAQSFVSWYLAAGNSPEEIEAALRSDAAREPRRRVLLEEGLTALRAVLDVADHSWYLPWIVEADANLSLPEFTEQAAREVLERFAEQARTALDQVERRT